MLRNNCSVTSAVNPLLQYQFSTKQLVFFALKEREEENEDQPADRRSAATASKT